MWSFIFNKILSIHYYHRQDQNVLRELYLIIWEYSGINLTDSTFLDLCLGIFTYLYSGGYDSLVLETSPESDKIYIGEILIVLYFLYSYSTFYFSYIFPCFFFSKSDALLFLLYFLLILFFFYYCFSRALFSFYSIISYNSLVLLLVHFFIFLVAIRVYGS